MNNTCVRRRKHKALPSLRVLWLGSKTLETAAAGVPGISPQFPSSISGAWYRNPMEDWALFSQSFNCSVTDGRGLGRVLPGSWSLYTKETEVPAHN